MNDDQIKEIRAIVQEEIALNSKKGSSIIPVHIHNGIDSLQISPADLLGFQIFTSAPAFKAKEGTIVLANISGSMGLWARINKTWVGVALT